MRRETILGLKFLNGRAADIVCEVKGGGLVVVPSAPVLIQMERDDAHREALADADFAVTDSGLMVLLWRCLKRARLERVSGLEYLECLLKEPSVREPGALAWVMPTAEARDVDLAWLQSAGISSTAEDCYLAPRYASAGRLSDPSLQAFLERRKPRHVIIALGGGTQERLGWYLRRSLSYRPAIHCIGAAIGFLSGDQVRVPEWADRLYLGWLCRCLDQPTRFIPRYWRAVRLVWLMIRYRERLPNPGSEGRGAEGDLGGTGYGACGESQKPERDS